MKVSVLLDKLIWLLTVVLIASFYLFNTNSYSRYIVLGITACIAVLEVLRYAKHFPLCFHSFHVLVFLFTAFCFLSYIWSIAPQDSLVQGSVILQIFICMSVLYVHYIQQPTTDDLVEALKWGGYVVALYVFIFERSSMQSALLSGGRLDNTFANMNQVSVCMALAATIAFYQMVSYKFKYSHLLLIPTIFVLAATGSRVGFVSLIGGVGAVLGLKYVNKNFAKYALFYVALAIGVFLGLKFLFTLPIFDTVNQRMTSFLNLFSATGQVDNSTFMRMWMLRVGWFQFLQTPLLGAGASSSGVLLERAIGWRTYLHNNYIELLSGCGLVGTGLYYSLYILPAYWLWKQRKYRLPNTDICLVLIFLSLLTDLSCVSYYHKATYARVLLFFIQVKINERYLKEKKTDGEELCN